MRAEWYNLSGKFDRRKMWGRMPVSPDKLPNLKGELRMYKYKSDIDKNGKIIPGTQRLVDYQCGANKVVTWAKIPLSFLVAGCVYKIGDAWEGYDDEDVGAGRTRGLDGSGDSGDDDLWKKAFVVPSDYEMYDAAGTKVTGLRLWNPEAGSSQAQFPFFPTKMRFGEYPDTGAAQIEKDIAEDQSRLYSYNEAPEEYEGDGREVTVTDGYYVFGSGSAYKQFVYAKRPSSLVSSAYFAEDNLWYDDSPDTVQNTTVYLSTVSGYLSALTLKVTLPEHDVDSYYCYDNYAIGQAELCCDAGSRDLIDNTGSFEEHYANMKDGLVYSIKNLGSTTKEASSKIVFVWILYF